MLSIVISAEKSLWINNPWGTLLSVSLWLFGWFSYFFESAICKV